MFLTLIVLNLNIPGVTVIDGKVIRKIWYEIDK